MRTLLADDLAGAADKFRFPLGGSTLLVQAQPRMRGCVGSLLLLPHLPLPCPAPPFCRYNRILAPQLRMFDDQRINLRQVDLDFDLN